MESLFPGTRRKVLSLFFMHPDKQFYFREVLKLTDTKQGTIQRELKSLTKAGILELETRGNQTYYSVNKSHPIYEELRRIVLKTFGLVDVLKHILFPFREKIEVATIYGSIASGEETAKSDIDLLVVGKISFDNLSAATSKAEKELKREINPTLYPIKEFKEKIKRKNYFLRSVLKSKMIFLIGNENDLARLAE
ncbi:MAG: nucleotidyltransferase domain-containing protein [candidate division Zixibacteria bacterium]|nr:nucleotidyltransferase domain-containing protein [candidate division Zixibacteria bacterium]